MFLQRAFSDLVPHEYVKREQLYIFCIECLLLQRLSMEILFTFSCFNFFRLYRRSFSFSQYNIDDKIYDISITRAEELEFVLASIRFIY